MTILSLLFQFGYLLFPFLVRLQWLELPTLCCIGVVRVDNLVVFQDLAVKLSVFHHWVLHWLWKWQVKVARCCLTLCNHMDCSLPGSSVHEDSPGQNSEVGSCSCLQGNLPNPGIKPRSPTLQVDSLLSELPVDYHKWLFNMLRYAPSIPTLVRVLIMNGCWILSSNQHLSWIF